MRELGERVRDLRVEPADGIRVEENGGWAQLVPDPDEPLFHIYAEGHDGEHSAALARRYREPLAEDSDLPDNAPRAVHENTPPLF